MIDEFKKVTGLFKNKTQLSPKQKLLINRTSLSPTDDSIMDLASIPGITYVYEKFKDGCYVTLSSLKSDIKRDATEVYLVQLHNFYNLPVQSVIYNTSIATTAFLSNYLSVAVMRCYKSLLLKA